MKKLINEIQRTIHSATDDGYYRYLVSIDFRTVPACSPVGGKWLKNAEFSWVAYAFLVRKAVGASAGNVSQDEFCWVDSTYKHAKLLGPDTLAFSTTNGFTYNSPKKALLELQKIVDVIFKDKKLPVYNNDRKDG